jgi:hypothetical protein
MFQILQNLTNSKCETGRSALPTRTDYWLASWLAWLAERFGEPWSLYSHLHYNQCFK